MNIRPLPAWAHLDPYNNLAEDLVKAYHSGDPEAMQRIMNLYQVERRPTWEELRASVQRRLGHKFALADAQSLIAREYGFENWPKLAECIEAMNQKGSPVSQFEAAVDAIIAGDVTTLESLLRENPELVRTRSTRVHRAALLHYVSANGIEDFRQKTPKNVVEVAKILLKAGAEVDAVLADGASTSLGLVATSVHPLLAGVQIILLETLLGAGAAVNGVPGGWNPLIAALHNGRGEAAEFLAKRGARLDLEGAAGVGRLDVVKSFFNEDGSLKESATREQMKSGFAWACEFGRTSVVDFLLQNGIEADTRLRYNGQTGLHWAAYCAHVDTVKLLLERGASVGVKDESFGGTPLGWALYGWGEPAPETKWSVP